MRPKNLWTALLLVLCVGLFHCTNQTTDKPDQPGEGQAFAMRLPSGQSAWYVVDKATGDTLFTSKKDSTITATYSYTVQVTDTFWHRLATGGPVTPPDTTTTPPVDPPPATGYIPAGYTQRFSNGFNSTADINSNQLPSTSLGQFITTQYKHSGAGAFRSVTLGINTSSGYRCEQQYTQAAANPKEFIIDFWIYFPAYKNTGWGGSAGFQYHPNNNGSGSFYLYGSEGRFTFTRNLNISTASGGTGGSNAFQGGSTTGGPKLITSATWYHVVVFGKWSTGTDGYFTAYIDNMATPYYSYKGRTQDNDGQPYLKVGQNNWETSRGTEQIIDDFTVYGK